MKIIKSGKINRIGSGKNKLICNKRAIELSVNFIVVLILAIVTFSLAIYLTYSIFAKSYQFKNDVDAQTRQQIRNLLDSGEKVAIPVNTVKIRQGQNDLFGVGVVNTERAPTDFYMEISELNTDGTTNTQDIKVYDVDGNAATDPDAKESAKDIRLSFITKIENVEINGQKTALIQAKVGDNVKAGFVYSYTVKICKSPGCGKNPSIPTYGFPQKIYINVP